MEPTAASPAQQAVLDAPFGLTLTVDLAREGVRFGAPGRRHHWRCLEARERTEECRCAGWAVPRGGRGRGWQVTAFLPVDQVRALLATMSTSTDVNPVAVNCCWETGAGAVSLTRDPAIPTVTLGLRDDDLADETLLRFDRGAQVILRALLRAALAHW